MPTKARLLGAALVLALLGPAACSSLPPPETNTPAGAVREYVAQVAAHRTASLRICSQPYPDGYHVLLIGGIFEPVGALPGFDVARTLSVIDLDISRLTFVERARFVAQAEVDVGGVLVERFDPSKVEALFRAYAAESGQPVELGMLQSTLDSVSRGPVELPVRESVRVVIEDGAWRVCPHAFVGEPTPGAFHLTSEPQDAPFALSIRVGDDEPSGWSETVPQGAPVRVDFTTLPDDDLRLWVNDQVCDGRFVIEAKVETDLLLLVTESECRVEVVGSHPEGALEHDPVPGAPAPGS